ncbi:MULTISPECIES: AraC family transcriptional regulator [unclassified Breznakia]|uniref:AraC family transcriptional regulator n=1 Tax=unclassified Breznakia TaxID=2623764 RepID=UPI0024767E15|nr:MULTISPECIES: AraC family transcriptional regulator [unclassified Breznakia]MDH6366784.1 AraC family cel operon transcriptional repressor [Breznakia sp. PH1-1]MDH6403829.1 AraC family cel operon transcriptional repressor [Breznakia sp. PF1-11]MDH6411538.1 AraC family cel operon transcriptional repressor [Breznakia sp. PFB1-11]MDH6413902.1 AraC family cel operon transcriptional repressor [Breznakia sp. PFB1-14]MDH6416331.1 AraC family cel operon transcriptional repressor [Breznakia sp. PFB1-
MNQQELHNRITTLNDYELFYKDYYDARKDKQSLQIFLDNLDIEFVKEHNLIIPDLKDTIPPIYLEEWFFDTSSKQNIFVQKHNCYSPNNPHKHNFFELLYVLEGSCKQTIGDISFDMKKGDVCLIPPEIIHNISVFDESIVIDIVIRRATFEDMFLNFLRSNNILSKFFMHNLYAPQATDYIIFHTNDDKEIESLIMDIFLEYINKEIYFNELLNNNLTSLFAKILRNYEDTCELPPEVNKNRTQAYELVRFIKDNYKDITLDDVAKHFHFTIEYTSRLIKKVTNSTFTKILRTTRLDISLALLTDTNISISDISNEIGYENVEHFIRIFKNQYNLTPSEYRKIYSTI